MQNSIDPEAGSEKTTAFRETYDKLSRTVEQYLEFAQSTRQAFIRLLLTLSAGSLVASISLLRFTVNAETAWIALLPISWVFLGISVLICLLHFASNYSYVWMLGLSRFFIDDAKESTKESVLADRVKAAEAFNDKIKDMKDDSDLKWDWRLSVSALISFFLGLLTLVVFATKNLPWSP